MRGKEGEHKERVEQAVPENSAGNDPSRAKPGNRNTITPLNGKDRKRASKLKTTASQLKKKERKQEQEKRTAREEHISPHSRSTACTPFIELGEKLATSTTSHHELCWSPLTPPLRF
eukprot:Hpha_TRINITY_DN16531_c3_g3::TRINITY_DN16531_c3_g3_i4::g.136361::m.136361